MVAKKPRKSAPVRKSGGKRNPQPVASTPLPLWRDRGRGGLRVSSSSQSRGASTSLGVSSIRRSVSASPPRQRPQGQGSRVSEAPRGRGRPPAQQTSSVNTGATKRKTTEPKKRKSTAHISAPVFKRRYKQPEKAIREIRYYQSLTDELIPKAPFCRLVREITEAVTRTPDLRYQALALDALQQAAETYLIGLFEDATLMTGHAKRVTLLPSDLQLAYRVRGDALKF